MKSIYFLALFLFTLVSFSQEATTSVKPIDDVNEEETEAVSFAIIEKKLAQIPPQQPLLITFKRIIFTYK
ncbi:hypothetical protein [Oceanihabitans sediminis]|uniref:Uncharacterized protein n=1 Tax=Oceanihabitans sediminis TaxID=1812012 RepID=A0A368P867_9FLAO|nr:hypothetical protein [Oceanihabitans sediminis]MDX1278397.1 hypothetical protein [Oceanihabitans sediminis]MDX1772637.1 hypothetical protein [Oceanihabitans sediminis]RBP34304.1 hypothetical protein DFR65_101192 [Oceanihabitans sediminis]RCU57989.1 hypothetical protein DU428_00955 [Oceanihabitans sediminis]